MALECKDSRVYLGMNTSKSIEWLEAPLNGKFKCYVNEKTNGTYR
jgi:hypothetical protein